MLEITGFVGFVHHPEFKILENNISETEPVSIFW
jgi:hypothetical protein